MLSALEMLPRNALDKSYFTYTGGYHLPHPSFYQPEASCGNLVSSSCNCPETGRGEDDGEM